MGGKAVPQCVNADTCGNAGTLRCQANDAVELARTGMLPAVAGKQPGLAGRHPSLLARHPPPFAQQIEKVGRENDIPILLPLALFDPDDHPVTIDIGELERYDLRGSQGRWRKPGSRAPCAWYSCPRRAADRPPAGS